MLPRIFWRISLLQLFFFIVRHVPSTVDVTNPAPPRARRVRTPASPPNSPPCPPTLILMSISPETHAGQLTEILHQFVPTQHFPNIKVGGRGFERTNHLCKMLVLLMQDMFHQPTRTPKKERSTRKTKHDTQDTTKEHHNKYPDTPCCFPWARICSINRLRHQRHALATRI